MDFLSFLVILLSILWTCIHLCRRKSTSSYRLPPGPYPFPVIGSIFSLGKKPHESLAVLSKIHGPLMSLKLGNLTTIIVSSPDIAQQVLNKHDQIFSGRIIPDVSRVLDHHKSSMFFLPTTNQWRNLRKISKEHMFSQRQLDSKQDLRRKKVDELLAFVRLQSCGGGEALEIGSAAFTTTLNLISNTLFSIDLAHYNSDSSQEFKNLVGCLLEVLGKPNLADYFSFVRFMDPQSFRRKMRLCVGKLLGIFDGIINQRIESRDDRKNDLLDVLLNLGKESGSPPLSRNDITHFLVDLFVGGTNTTSITVEWAMTELLRNPNKLAKARAELETVIGQDTNVQESDIAKLPYLQSVVKETFRLHPAAPLLIPHKAEAEAEIGSFVVPKNAQILINAWAMGRDPSVWENPQVFMPERFLNCEIDFKGQDFKLIPFGAGRRMCPGLALADRMVHLMLASLLLSFDWKLEKGLKPQDIDMSERFGLAMQKAVPLKAIPVKCL